MGLPPCVMPPYLVGLSPKEQLKKLQEYKKAFDDRNMLQARLLHIVLGATAIFIIILFSLIC